MWVNILLSSAAQSARQGPHHIHHISIYRLHGASISRSTILTVKKRDLRFSLEILTKQFYDFSYLTRECRYLLCTADDSQPLLQSQTSYSHDRPSITQQNVFIHIYQYTSHSEWSVFLQQKYKKKYETGSYMYKQYTYRYCLAKKNTKYTEKPMCRRPKGRMKLNKVNQKTSVRVCVWVSRRIKMRHDGCVRKCSSDREPGRVSSAPFGRDR